VKKNTAERYHLRPGRETGQRATKRHYRESLHLFTVYAKKSAEGKWVNRGPYQRILQAGRKSALSTRLCEESPPALPGVPQQLEETSAQKKKTGKSKPSGAWKAREGKFPGSSPRRDRAEKAFIVKTKKKKGGRAIGGITSAGMK